MKLKKIGENCHELEINGTYILFSYQTPVAANFRGRFLRTMAGAYSATTTKHVSQWLPKGCVAEVKEPEWFIRTLPKLI